MKMLFLGVFVGLSVGAAAMSFVFLQPSHAPPHFKCAIWITTVEEADRLDATAHALDLTQAAKSELIDQLDRLATMGPEQFQLISNPVYPVYMCTVS
jgi:hypothetical protein